MGMTYVQSATAVTNGGSSITATLNNVTEGHLLVFSARNYVACTVKDSQSNTYTQVVSTGGLNVYLATAGSTGNITFTLTVTSGTSNIGMTVLEYYCQGTFSYDTSTTGFVTAGTLTGSVSFTPNYQNEMFLFACVMQDETSGSLDLVTQTSGPNFIFRQNSVEAPVADFSQSAATGITMGFSLAANTYGCYYAVIGIKSSPIWLVQTTGVQTNASITTSPWTVAFTHPVTTGNLLVMMSQWNNGTLTSVTDTLGNTYSAGPTHTSGAVWGGFYYTFSQYTGANSVELNFTGTINNSNSMILSEWGGLKYYDDGSSNFPAYGLGPNNSSLVTHYPGLVLAGVNINYATASSVPSGFTSVLAVTSGYTDAYLYYAVTSSAGTQTADWNWSGDAYSLNLMAGFYTPVSTPPNSLMMTGAGI